MGGGSRATISDETANGHACVVYELCGKWSSERKTYSASRPTAAALGAAAAALVVGANSGTASAAVARLKTP